MRVLSELWTDDVGSVLSAEAVALATIAILGVTVGATTAVNAVAAEWADFAQMIRSLNQNFGYGGIACGNASAAGSSYTLDDPEADRNAIQFNAITPQAVNDIVGEFALQQQSRSTESTNSTNSTNSKKSGNQIEELMKESDTNSKSSTQSSQGVLNQQCEI